MDYKSLDKKYIIGTYNRFDVCIESGDNATATDINGKTYIDFSSGIGVNSLGYNNEKWTKAVKDQVDKLSHTSNLYYNKNQIELAEKLSKVTGYSKVFFANSGAEANEGAIKIARKYSFDKYKEGRNKIICLNNSFHGRTITTLSATGQEVFHNYFFPFNDGFLFADANDINSIKNLIDDSVCGIMVETVQGEGGVLPLEKDFLQGIRNICDEKDLIFIIDEVQTGVGRCGTFLSQEKMSVKADIITLAKGLGGGLPIGAVLTNEKTMDVLSFSDHGTTFGGNPVAMAGAKVCVDEISNPEFLKEVNRKGEIIKNELKDIKEVKEIRGMGMMVGICLNSKKAIDIVDMCLEKGLIVLTAKTFVRLLPPLTISDKELYDGLKILKEVLEK